MPNSPVINISTGFLNTVNDAADGQATSPSYIGGSYFAGQLGKICQFDDSNVPYNASVGTVFGGQFQYVTLASGAGSFQVGQALFWDRSVGAGIYQVTTAENQSTDNAELLAGIMLNAVGTVTPGNNFFIQIAGLALLKFRGTLTSAGARGSRVYTAGAGAGADNGLFDVLDVATPAQQSDISLMQGRFAGVAFDAPANGSLTKVDLNFRNVRF